MKRCQPRLVAKVERAAMAGCSPDADARHRSPRSRADQRQSGPESTPPTGEACWRSRVDVPTWRSRHMSLLPSASASPVTSPVVKDRLFIGGAWVAPASTRTIDVVSPHTEQVIATVPEADGLDIDRAVAAARTAFDD